MDWMDNVYVWINGLSLAVRLIIYLFLVWMVGTGIWAICRNINKDAENSVVERD